MTHSVTLTIPSSSSGSSLLLSSSNYNNGHGTQNRSQFGEGGGGGGYSSGGHRGYSNNHQNPVAGLATAVGKAVVGPPTNLLFGGLLLIWYAVSVGHNILNKRLLESDLFPFPFTLTLFQLTEITFYSYAYIALSWKRGQSPSPHVIVPVSEAIGRKRNRNLILFLSLGKFMSLVFSHLSLYQVPLAFTHTVKGGLPLFVVVFSRIFLKTKHSTAVYVSLVPIVLGISLASLNSNSQDANFNWGIIFAVMSTVNLALLNVFSKKLLTTSYSAISLLHLLSKMSLLIFLPFYVVSSIVSHREAGYSMPSFTVNLPLLLFLDGLLSFTQNLLAFTLLSLCTPLTYSIANCSKRVAIISLSFFFFSIQNISSMSLFGIFLSLFGIFCYNVAKHTEKRREQSPSYVKLDQNGTNKNGYSLNV